MPEIIRVRLPALQANRFAGGGIPPENPKETVKQYIPRSFGEILSEMYVAKPGRQIELWLSNGQTVLCQLQSVGANYIEIVRQPEGFVMTLQTAQVVGFRDASGDIQF